MSNMCGFLVNRGKIQQFSLLSTVLTNCLLFDGINAVTLSKTKKKGREHKKSMVDLIRQAVENYNSIYVFTVENMRNLKFKELREQLKSSSRQVVFSDFFYCIFSASLQILISDENVTSYMLFDLCFVGRKEKMKILNGMF